MNPEHVRAHLKRVEEIVHAALEQTADDRPSFVRAACRGDASLLADVESLLANASAAAVGDHCRRRCLCRRARFSEPFQMVFRASWADEGRAFIVNRAQTISPS
jgi:hypothetical protein